MEKEMPKVDVYNDVEMVNLGIRVRKYEGRDPKIWTKSFMEKKDSKFVKANLKHHFEGSNWPAPKKITPVYGKLIVTIKPNDRFKAINKKGKNIFKTVFSHECYQHNISSILNKYVDDKSKCLVVKYYWNGKTYRPGVLPYWK